MIIAIASEGNMVAGHFGHCEGFTIFKSENNTITTSEFAANPGHKPGFLPVFLHEKGVNVIISGGMGAGAIDIFNEKGIEVVTGAQGNVEAVANKYLQGELQSTGSVCREHMHHDDCGH